ncbi:MAG: TadE/TadG family type IV pilus assembly protein [Candidatus Baltobacteraceae bacterium]
METALILPLFLLVLYGVIWIIRAGVVNERVQIAVRYSGLVSNEVSPYVQYSMYALYNNLEGIGSPPTFSCGAPTTDALENNGQFPGPLTSSFWFPSGVTTGTCTPGETSLQPGVAIQPEIFTHTLSQITSATPIQGVLSSALGSVSQSVSAAQNYLDAPGLGTVLTCLPEVDDAVSASLQRTKPSLNVNSIAPLADVLPRSAFALAGGC